MMVDMFNGRRVLSSPHGAGNDGVGALHGAPSIPHNPIGYDYHGRRVVASRHAGSIRYDERLLVSIMHMDDGEPLETWTEYRVNGRRDGYDVYRLNTGTRNKYDYINDPAYHYEKYDGESYIPHRLHDWTDVVERSFNHELGNIADMLTMGIGMLTMPTTDF